MALTEYEKPSDLETIRSKKANAELLQYLNKCYSVSRQGRMQFERQWYLNLAFYFGRQYAQWTSSALTDTLVNETAFNRLYEPAVPPWRVRLICNKVRPIIRGELSKVTKENPRGFVLPASSDNDDLAAARAAESINDFLFRTVGVRRICRRAEFWNLICGNSFIKDWYDKNAEDASGVKGKICAEHSSAFHILVPDLQEEEIENQPFAMHLMAKDPEWVHTHYGVEINGDSGNAGLLEQKFLQAVGINNAVTTKKYVTVKEIYIKSCSKFPDGCFAQWAGDQILFLSEKWPYQHKEFPFAKLDHIPCGRFYSDSTITDLIPLQKEFNRTRSQIIEAKNRMSKPQLIAPKGSVDPRRITSEPGLIIFYTPGFTPPQPLPLQPIPNYVVEEVNRIQRDMDDISSQHEITKGSVPPGVTAATAISYLQEQDDSKLAPTIASLEEAVEKVGRHFLSHVQQFWTAERQVSVVGANGQFESFMFSRANIRGNTDFKVEVGSATPTSRAAKQAFIMELGDKGWVQPTQAMKYLDMAETAKLYEEGMRDARQAQRENLKMTLGADVPTNTFDNDLVHIMEHENECKTEAYENSQDQIKVNFQKHIGLHKQRYAQMAGIPMMPGDPKLDGLIRGIAPMMPPGEDPNAGGAPQGDQQGAV